LKTSETFDSASAKEKIVISGDAKIKNEVMKNNERLIALFTTYETMNGKLTKEQDEGIVGEIDNILFGKNKAHMNYTAFSQYLMVWDMPYSALQSHSEAERRHHLRGLIIKYIKERHQMYMSHGYSNIVMQVVSDNYSHKRGGSTGTDKLANLLERAGIAHYESGFDLINGSFYLLPDKGDKKLFKKICEGRGIKFIWSTAKTGKMPDCYIQKASKSYIVEHKHKKGGGGGQNSQIVEIVDFIKYSDENVSYVAFLDGILFNELADASGENKMSTAKKDIINCLNTNKNNYFVNTAGFSKLVLDI